MEFNRRVALSALSLPALAGLTGMASPKQQLPDPGLTDPGLTDPVLPDPGLPDPELPDLPGLDLPSFQEGAHDTVLTEAAAAAFDAAGLVFGPAAGSTAVPEASRPSTRLILSGGNGLLTLLAGFVHFDGGFAITEVAQTEQTGRRLQFASFTSDLAAGVAKARLWVDGEPGERIPAFSYDLTESSVSVDPPNLALGEYNLYLTDEAIAAIHEVFPGALCDSASAFATGAASGTFALPATSPTP